MERIQETLDSFLDWLEREGKSVICYGASAMAEEALREDRLASRVQYFVDSDTEKQGELVRLADRRFPVHSPAQLRQEDFFRTVLLAYRSGCRSRIWHSFSRIPQKLLPAVFR